MSSASATYYDVQAELLPRQPGSPLPPSTLHALRPGDHPHDAGVLPWKLGSPLRTTTKTYTAANHPATELLSREPGPALPPGAANIKSAFNVPAALDDYEAELLPWQPRPSLPPGAANHPTAKLLPW